MRLNLLHLNLQLASQNPILVTPTAGLDEGAR